MRDVGRAYAVAVCDGGKPLYVNAEHPGEHFRLHFTELWEPLGDVRDRAMVLTQLLTRRRWQRGRNVAILSQSGSQCIGRSGAGSGIIYVVAIAILDLGNAGLRELADRIVPARLGQELEHRDGQIVVRGIEGGTSGVGQREYPGRSAPTARSIHPLLPSLDLAAGKQDVKVAADTCRGQAQPSGQLGRCRRPVLED